MPKIEYELKRFQLETLAIIQQAEDIINTYQAQGFSLTLRQLYYQFVARALLANTERNYKRLGNIISDARRAGLIDWDAIEDRTRYLRRNNFWESPQSILQSAVNSYHRDLWANQPCRIEVWIEKDALVGVIADKCEELDVPYFSCRGYVSDSEMWSASGRMFRQTKKHQQVIVLHLGDHDPSGIDMTRDIEGRLKLFSFSAPIEIRRLALTMEQIGEINPPPNPAKFTDSRYEGYVAEYGDESWELDALEPQYIVDLIEQAILEVRDIDRWEQSNEQQESERQLIQEVIDHWVDNNANTR